MRWWRILSWATMMLAVGAGCGRTSVAREEPREMARELGAELAVIRQGRILFTHHSVGVNILAGMERIDAAAGGSRLRMATLDEAATLAGPVLAHGGGGRNTDPRSKIDAFAALIRREPLLGPDLAFMKLCFVDFEPTTDVGALFSYYQRTLEALKRERPGMRFGHVTVPLFRRPTDLKSSLKRLAGREVWEDAANARRAEFNERLRRAFASDPIFDLAGAEATGPDGRTASFEVAGREVPSLDPRYTEDGGHLNALGQEVVGAEAIRFLARALQGSAQAP